MKSEKTLPEDYNKPVAYDANGRPLYAHPPTKLGHSEAQNQTVHIMRPAEPEKQIITKSVKQKHDQSTRDYPGLNLSEGEYVISSIRRNPIGLIAPLLLGGLLIIFAITFMFNFDIVIKSFQFTGVTISSSAVVLPVFLFIILIALGMYVVYYVYFNNKFYLTNESVIQEIQTSIFSKLEQTVSLTNIEDASYTQNGIIQQMFNYGSIRLSTEGEETTYRFSYVTNPKQAIATLNNAVEAFKNGRAIVND